MNGRNYIVVVKASRIVRSNGDEVGDGVGGQSAALEIGEKSSGHLEPRSTADAHARWAEFLPPECQSSGFGGGMQPMQHNML